MNVQDLIRLCEAKTTRLEATRREAEAIGDILAVTNLEAELATTSTTLAMLKSQG